MEIKMFKTKVKYITKYALVESEDNPCIDPNLSFHTLDSAEYMIKHYFTDWFIVQYEQEII